MEKRAIVVGATSGIGLEVAKILAEKGWKVGIAGRRIERLQEIMSDWKTKHPQSDFGIMAYQQIDITTPDSPALLHSLIDRLGGLDLYFHSSGIGWQNNDLQTEKELKTVQTNCLGFTRMVDEVVNYYKAESENLKPSETSDTTRTFQLACISSIARTKGLGCAPAYSATKRYQSHYLECLSQMVRMNKLPIHITDIRPGFVATDLIAGSHYPLQLKAEDVARQIVRAIEHRKSVVTIDWRYRLLVTFWQLIPRPIWVRMKVGK